MGNASRDYGLDWERELVRVFKKLDPKCLRTPNSGAFGTRQGIAALQGDVLFGVDDLQFLVEAKAGYGGSKSMALKKEWIIKTIAEAENQIPQRIPLLALKFKNGRGKQAKNILLTIEDFMFILEKYRVLDEKLSLAYDYIMSLKDKVDIQVFMRGEKT